MMNTGSVCERLFRGITRWVNLELLFPPTLIKRALEDLGAIADAARRLPELEQAVLGRIDSIRSEAFERVDVLQAEIVRMREAVEPLPGQLEAVNAGLKTLQEEMKPIQELPAVRAAVEPLPEKLDEVNAGLKTLQEEMKPIQELPAVRAAVEPLGEKLDALQQDIGPQLTELRKGIEPLDEDMNAVRGSIDEIEPLVRNVLTRLGALDKRIEAMRSAIGPIGELADKIPGVG
jgi:chromosome segregation ATPase